jgi:hypothetical protein
MLLGMVFATTAGATNLVVDASAQFFPANGPEPLATFVADNITGGLTANWLHPGILAATVTRGPGLSIRTDMEGFYDAGNWSTSPVFPGIEDPHYFLITLQIDPEYQAALAALHIAYHDAGSAESARRLELRGSTDGFASVLFTDYAVATWPDVDYNAVALTFAGWTGGTLEYRLYGYGAVTDLGVIGLVNTAMIDAAGEDGALVLFGAIIPEPAMAALLAAGAALAMLLGRRRAARAPIPAGDPPGAARPPA